MTSRPQEEVVKKLSFKYTCIHYTAYWLTFSGLELFHKGFNFFYYFSLTKLHKLFGSKVTENVVSNIIFVFFLSSALLFYGIWRHFQETTNGRLGVFGQVSERQRRHWHGQLVLLRWRCRPQEVGWEERLFLFGSTFRYQSRSQIFYSRGTFFEQKIARKNLLVCWWLFQQLCFILNIR